MPPLKFVLLNKQNTAKVTNLKYIRAPNAKVLFTGRNTLTEFDLLVVLMDWLTLNGRFLMRLCAQRPLRHERKIRKLFRLIIIMLY